jgi:PGM1 C-terminal domain
MGEGTMSGQDDLPMPQLGISEAEAASRFDGLQRKLVPLWQSIRELNQDEQTIVVIPSQSLEFDCRGAEMQGYEERFLFLLLLLRQPRARLVYVTSQTILPATIDYYLGLLPGVIASHARRRLFTVAPEDRSLRPLSLKLLERPQLVERIRALIQDPDRAHMVPFVVTLWERDLALRLGIPLYGADPRFFPLGTKSGCRRLFAEVGVAHPLGREDLWSIEAVVEALAALRQAKPGIRKAMVKLNEAVSGQGNAVVDLEGLPDPGAGGATAALAARVREMRFEAPNVTLADYAAKLEERGGVVEERIVGAEIRSPSAQLRVTPLGEVELLSTHDQLLGGPTGQLYLGCRFPADPAYAALIGREARKVGARLAREGVLGRFAVDFVVVRGADGVWVPYAIELNLRKGGTTHPFLTLQFLTDGSYDEERGVFVAPSGREKCFVASDHLESALYRAFTPDDLFDIVIRHGLHFDQTRQVGIVFHMLATLAENGRIGATAVGNSPDDADRLLACLQAALEDEAQRALEPRALPEEAVAAAAGLGNRMAGQKSA